MFIRHQHDFFYFVYYCFSHYWPYMMSDVHKFHQPGKSGTIPRNRPSLFRYFHVHVLCQMENAYVFNPESSIIIKREKFAFKII